MHLTSELTLRLKTGAIDETKKLFGIFVYFWVLLSLFSFHKALILNDESLLYHQGFALINALALAKVVLVGEFFQVGDQLKNRPLIYPIIFKSAVFASILICFHIIEETVIGVLHGNTLSQSIPNIGGGTLQGILMVGIIMFVVLMPFFAFRELDRAIGTEPLRLLLFGRETNGAPKPGQQAGREVGRAERHEVGHAEGYEGGRGEGYEAEQAEGYEEGYKKGYDEGFKMGVEAKEPLKPPPLSTPE